MPASDLSWVVTSNCFHESGMAGRVISAQHGHPFFYFSDGAMGMVMKEWPAGMARYQSEPLLGDLNRTRPLHCTVFAPSFAAPEQKSIIIFFLPPPSSPLSLLPVNLQE